MSIHIGKIIQAHVEEKRLTQKEFGALIHKNEKTVPNIYGRASMSIDLLIAISAALRKDYLIVFYSEEPMKSLRDDEIIQLNIQIKVLADKIEQLLKELTGKQELIDMLKGNLTLATERLNDYKNRVQKIIRQVEIYWKITKDAFNN